MPELPAAAVRFNVLGVLEAWRDGGRITIPAGRQRQLLCLLMIERGAVVSADRVIDELWEGAPPATAVKAVHVSVSSIRRALGPDRALLETHERGYRLALPPGSLDVDRFAELVERGRGELAEGMVEPASATLSAALALWRGEPFADVAGHGFARAAISRLTEARTSALEDRIEADLACGCHREVVAELEALCAADPERERPRGQLMIALWRSGRRSRALEVYDIGRRTLAEQLGIEPGEELRRIHRQILDDSERPPGEPPQPPRARARRPLLAIAAGVAAAVLLTVALLLGRSSSRPPAAQGSRTLVVAANSVAVIDGHGALLANTTVGRSPSELVAGAGSIWVLNANDGTVDQLDPATAAPRTPPFGFAAPSAIAFAGGSLWVGTAGGAVRVDPVRHITTARIPIRGSDPDCGALELAAVGPLLWAERLGVVHRIAAASARVTANYGSGAERCATFLGAIAADRDAVWLRGYYAGLTRVDARSGAGSQPLEVPVGGGPIATWGTHIWAADRTGSAIDLLDTLQGRLVTAYPLPSAPTALSAMGSGLWVTCDDGWVIHIDASTGRESRLAKLTRTPTAVLAAGEGVYVAVA